MDIHFCSIPQSRMENFRRECANRHCKPNQELKLLRVLPLLSYHVKSSQKDGQPNL